MFVRCKKQGDKIRVQIVKSVRDGKAVRQRVLRHIGTATNDVQLRKLKQLGGIILEKLEQEQSSQLNLLTTREYSELYIQSREAPQTPEVPGPDLFKCCEVGQVSVGIREAFGELYIQFGWDRLFGARRMSANRILKELVLARLHNPMSKRGTVRALPHHGDVRLDLDRVHETMDFLDDAFVRNLCDSSFLLARKLYDEPVSMIFCNVTMLYFESEMEDEMRREGFIKDDKSRCVEIIFALLMTGEGIPCGYQVFSGNTWKGGTLIGALGGWKEHWPETRFTVVADAGLLDNTIRKVLADNDIPYILGTRLGIEPAARQAEILDPDGFRSWTPDPGVPVPVSRYKDLRSGEDRLVVTYAPKRAHRDARQRRRALEKLCRRLEKSEQAPSVSQRGYYTRFLTFSDGKVAIDPNKVATAARWDGLGGVVACGLDDLDARDLIIQYRRLWEIKACFRTNKHDIRFRPVLRWGEHLVRAHIAICYMAFCCLQHLRYRLALRSHPMSPDAIRRELSQLQIGVIRHDDGSAERYGMPSLASEDAKQIYRCLGLKWNHRVFPVTVEQRMRKLGD